MDAMKFCDAELRLGRKCFSLCSFTFPFSRKQMTLQHSTKGEQPLDAINLKSNWNVLCHQKGIEDETIEKWWQKLSLLYSEPKRHYHTLNHIGEINKWIVKYESEIEDLSAVHFAMWFHEYVFKTFPLNIPFSLHI
jgi:hypothetical protein